jgi:hypothetical protein
MTLPIRMTSATLLLAMALSGCTEWQRNDAVLLQPIPERAKVEINANGMRVVVHGVRVDSQNVSYVEMFQAPACDSCRAFIPRASIDSIRVRAPNTVGTVLLVAGLLILFFSIDWSTHYEPYT